MGRSLERISMQLSKVNLLFKSGIPVVNIDSPLQERMNVIKSIYQESALLFNLPLIAWNAGWGCFKKVNYNLKSIEYITLNSRFSTINTENIVKIFDYILQTQGNYIFILENLFSTIQDNQSGFFGEITSQIINLYYDLKGREKLQYLIILTTDNTEQPKFLSNIIPTIFTPLPTLEEITALLREKLPKLSDNNIYELANVASGLTLEELCSGIAIGVNSQKINDSSIASNLLDYKVNCLKNFNLNFKNTSELIGFAGLDLLKKYIKNVKKDFSPRARTANIPLPKGCLLVGPPGTGKTLAANICARELGFPLISLDAGVAVESGVNDFKRMLQRVEACGSAVLYFDEFDKLFIISNSSAEDKKSQQILGILLTWLQDKRSSIFVIATLNRLDALPPELTRVGRFDQIFYVGFPNAFERKQIISLHAARFDKRYQNKDPLTEKEWKIILNKTVNCTGAELAKIVEQAARTFFYEDQPCYIDLLSLLQQRAAIVPLYIRDTDRILAIENRAKEFAQPASSSDTKDYAPPIRSYWGN